MIQLVYSAIVGVHRISNTYFNSPVIARDINTGRYTLPGAIDAVDTRGRLDTIYASIGRAYGGFHRHEVIVTVFTTIIVVGAR